MLARRRLAVGWAVALAGGLAGRCELLVGVAAYGVAILLASVAFRLMHDAPAEALSGRRRLAYLGATGALVLVGVGGFVGSVTGATTGRASVLDAPLALYFMMIAVLGWRALVVTSPGRAALVTFVALLAYIPLGAYDAMLLHRTWSVPSWYRELSGAATLGSLVGAGVLGLVAALAFQAPADVAVPEARRL